MFSRTTSLLQKLTFLVLLGILACLIVIIAQNRRSSQTAEVQAGEDVAVPEAPAEAEPVVTEMPVRRPVQVPATKATNRVVSSAPTRPAASRIIAVAEQAPGTDADRAAVIDRFVEPAVYGTVVPVVPSGVASGTVITGRVTLMGTPPPEIPIDVGAVCGRLHPDPVTTRHYVVSPEGGLANALVYLEEGLDSGSIATEGEPPLLDNVGCLFEPYVIAIRVGQSLVIRNSDPTFHNIHVVPRDNLEFNFALPGRNQIAERKFSKPERFIRVKCDVHPWMFAYISVLPHPFFAVTDSTGSYRLPPLAHGTYALVAQHQKGGLVRERVSLSGTGERIVNFTIKLPTPQVSQR